jgi:amyloid beta precursor protein binding protein 1
VLLDVGRFTLIDDALTTSADKNNNFFIDVHSIGRPRAEVVTELLLEMNAEVKGNALVKDARTLLSAADLSYFRQFSLVVVSDPRLTVRDVLPLAEYLWNENIPFVLIQCKGLLGSVRLQIREHAIIESHPGNARYDLYVHPEQTKRWPELQQYFNQFRVFKSDFEGAGAPTPDGEEHAHIPYNAILAHCIARWSSTHGGNLPRTYDEKKAFKEFIRASAWSGEEGNFDEAIDFAHYAYDLPVFDRFVQSVFDDAAVSDESILKRSNFWLMVRAVREFIAREGGGICYPVSQNLPDMHCKTAYYVQLKQLFQKRAEADFAAVKQHLHTILASLSLPADRVSDQELDSFVRNVRTLRVIRTRSLSSEYGSDGASTGGSFQTDVIREILEDDFDPDANEDDDADDDMSDAPPRKPRHPHNVHWYIALRSADIFQSREGRAPGTASAGNSTPLTIPQLEADFAAVTKLAEQLLKTTGLNDVIDTPHAATLGEVVRSGASEPHVTAAFLGGLASQLSLKLLLKQFVPLNNTVLWNGLIASTTTFQM